MKIGCLYGSYKPFHCGHFNLINQAAKECEQIFVYVSLSDRVKNKEYPVYGKDMANIWINYLLDIMPKNVNIIFVEESPIRKIYSVMGETEQSKNDESYVIYSDPNDIVKNFPEKALLKYFPWLYNDGRISFKGIRRENSNEISGTQMRKYLMNNDKENFYLNLPKPLTRKEEIWNILKK